MSVRPFVYPSTALHEMFWSDFHETLTDYGLVLQRKNPLNFGVDRTDRTRSPGQQFGSGPDLVTSDQCRKSLANGLWSGVDCCNTKKCNESPHFIMSSQTIAFMLAIVGLNTSSSAMAERPRELDQRFQMAGGQFEAIIDWGVTFRAIATQRNLRLRIIW